MKLMKNILKCIVIVLVLSILTFIASLWLNNSSSKSIYMILEFLLFLIGIYSIKKLFTGKLNAWFLKGRQGALLLMCSSLALSINVLIIIKFNSAVIEYQGKNLAPLSKLEIYRSGAEEILFPESKLNKFTSSMKKLEDDNIIFYYDNEKSSQYSIEMIKEVIPQVEKDTDRLFGKISGNKLKVILYKDKQELLSIRNYGFNDMDGCYNRKTNSIHVINFDKKSSGLEFKRIFTHEYTHYKYYSFIKQNKINNSVPIWFSEGIAEYVGYNEANIDHTPLTLNKKKSLKELNSKKEFERAYKDVCDAYDQSYYAIDYLVKAKSEDVIPNILLKTKNIEFYSAFESVTGMSIEEFQKNYLKEIK